LTKLYNLTQVFFVSVSCFHYVVYKKYTKVDIMGRFVGIFLKRIRYAIKQLKKILSFRLYTTFSIVHNGLNIFTYQGMRVCF